MLVWLHCCGLGVDLSLKKKSRGCFYSAGRLSVTVFSAWVPCFVLLFVNAWLFAGERKRFAARAYSTRITLIFEQPGPMLLSGWVQCFVLSFVNAWLFAGEHKDLQLVPTALAIPSILSSRVQPFILSCTRSLFLNQILPSLFSAAGGCIRDKVSSPLVKIP